MQQLSYESLEKIRIGRPVERVGFIADLCRGKRVLDLGCYDETALIKRDRDSGDWLHGRIAASAQSVIGIDNSAKIPAEGIVTAPNAVIRQGDGTDPFASGIDPRAIDIAVAGEFIEHIESPLQFFRNMKRDIPGRELVVSTPNGAGFVNALLGTAGREVQHHDHIQIFSYKILNTLCLRAGFKDWEIHPYRFYATEMILGSTGAKKLAALGVERGIRVVERLFPILSFGYVVHIHV